MSMPQFSEPIDILYQKSHSAHVNKGKNLQMIKNPKVGDYHGLFGSAQSDDMCP